MKNVYNHTSRPIKGIGCALYQCVRVIPVPAWMLKLGSGSIQLPNFFNRKQNAEPPSEVQRMKRHTQA